MPSSSARRVRGMTGTPARMSSIGAAIASTDQLIVDLDGTLVRGGEPTPGAAEFLARFEGRVAIVSNNSTETASRMSAVLARVGLGAPPDKLVLAGEEMIRFAAERFAGARCFCLTTAPLRRLAVRYGLRLVETEPDIVLLGRDPSITYDKISAVVNVLRRGAKLVVANPDLSHPGVNGDVVPETGTLMSAIVAGSGVQPHHVVGKPEVALFQLALQRLGSSPVDTVVVGDNPDTDGAGAARLGMRCVLIGLEPPAVAPTLACYLEMIGP